MAFPDEGQSELESILSQSNETQGSGQADPTYLDGPGLNEQLTRNSPQTQNRENQNPQNQLLAGKFKTPQDLEKGYRSAESALGKATSRAKQLERLIQTPGVYERLASSPEGRDTLAALGFEMREADTQEEQQNQGGYDSYDEGLIRDLSQVLGREPTERDLMKYEITFMKEEQKLNWQLFRFGQSRGKELNPQEERGIRNILRVAPRLTVDQAYRLTPEYEQSVKAQQDKAVDAVRSKGSVKRPAPNPTLLPGQKSLDLKKPVTEMNDAERRAYITDLAERGGA